VTRPAVIYGPWLGGPWVRVSPASLPRPEPVELSGGTRLPPSRRRAQAEATVRIFCPAEKAAPVEPTLVAETDAQRRAREAKAATAGWT